LTGHSAENTIGKISIQEIYNIPEMARKIKEQFFSEDFGGSGSLDGVEVTVKGPEGEKVPIRLSKESD